MKKSILFLLIISTSVLSFAQSDKLIHNIGSRYKTSLNGTWKIIIDPYENGFYNYRWDERNDGFFRNDKMGKPNDLIEYNFDYSETLHVPGDWNSQKEKLDLYEGTIWYRKVFNHSPENQSRYFLYFGAVNYKAYVYINGHKLGMHEGGFTPFHFEVTQYLQDGDNFVVVKVDNKRMEEGVPTLNTDWWNYGGITRDVYLVKMPSYFIQDYFLQLKKNSLTQIEGWIKLDQNILGEDVKIEIPEVGIKKIIKTDENGFAKVSFEKKLKLWSPENPKLYKVTINTSTDTVTDYIGFRSIETKGKDILLNGKPIFLKGICIHEEAPFRGGRANGLEDAATLLGWAKELGCNYVRLAHYPHNEAMVQMAEKMGLMVWAEIPVYWTIQYEKEEVFLNARNQLSELISRDKNRAPVIIWSMANETPVNDTRNQFIKNLATHARSLDPTRLISAALEIHHTDGNDMILDDPLGEYLDVLGCNEYIGWYTGTAEDCLNKSWKSTYNKPLVISEFGAGALFNYRGDKNKIWTEEFQENVYINQIQMLKKIDFLRGVSPWILVDFRSPRRQLPDIQDFYNRKGLISNKGQKKKAWFVMQDYYSEMK